MAEGWASSIGGSVARRRVRVGSRRVAVACGAVLALVLATVGRADAAPKDGHPRPTRRPAVADHGRTVTRPPGVSGTSAPTPPDPAQPGDLTPIRDGFGPTPAEQVALHAAAAQARRTGAAVPVGALTTETQQVLAKPGGGFAMTANTKPVRTTQQGRWVPVDLTLHRNLDQTLSPAATAYGSVTLSGGGTGPLATTTAGRIRFAVSWPTRLPAPTLTGPAATYREVLPGVDLVVSATAAGGFSEILVIKTPAAGRNPALADLRLAVGTSAGRLRATRGGLRLTGAADGPSLEAAPALMWDSNTSLSAVTGPARGPAARPSAAAGTVAPDRSTDVHPGQAARLRLVGVTATPTSIRLAPDQRLLTDPATVFPVYVDPTFNWHPTTGGTPAFDEVKQGSPCTNTSFYNNAGAAGDNGQLGVGVNHWTSCIGTMHAHYQWNLPHLIWGAHINTATVNATEVYSASCSTTATVNLHQTGAINSATAWSNRPAYLGTFNAAVAYGPSFNGGNCPGNGTVTHGFTVTTLIAKAASGHAGSLSVALAEDANESNGDSAFGFKRFADNPTLQISYNRPPTTPAATALSATSGADNAGCATTAPYPFMGKTIKTNTTTPALNAKISDPDTDHLRATFKYWVDGTTTTATGLSGDNLTSGSTAHFNLPVAFVSALTNGKIVDWQTQVTDGQDTSAWSPVCHFTAEPDAPSQPTIVSADGKYPDTDNGGGTGSPAGTTGLFTFTNTGTAATKFGFRLDIQPATSNPPASQVVPAVNNTAVNVPVPVLTPGAHILWVEAIDAANDPSSMTAYHFLADHDPAITCASLAACFNNTAISPDTNMGLGAADGTASYSATDLTNAGWTSGAHITINGATLTVPAYGSGQPDNVLAAGQTITLNQPIPGHGPTALTFLATATNATGEDPGAIDGNTTAPYAPAGTAVAGVHCFDSNDPSTFCAPAGKITFQDGTFQPYQLLVPDWTTGPAALAALALPHLNRPTGQLTDPTKQPRIYTFSVPIRPDQAGNTITSITLPDLGSTVSGGITGLHIFAAATRNTTQAASGQTWTGAFANPTEGAYNTQTGTLNYANQTFRIALWPSISGTTVRVKLDNAMGVAPLAIGHTTIALSGDNATAAATGSFGTLTFAGANAITIPTGAMAYSDPLPFTITANQNVLVSFKLTNSVPFIPGHRGSPSVLYTTPPGTGDHTTDTAGTAFGGFDFFVPILADLDVATVGAPTQAVLGDGMIDIDQPNTNQQLIAPALSDDISRAWPTSAVPYGTVAEGIDSNQILGDSPESVIDWQTGNTVTVGGPSVLSRIDRDILDQPGLTTVILNEGLDDVLNRHNADDLDGTGYTQLLASLQANNINTVFIGLTPCDGYTGDGATGRSTNDPCTPAVDDERTTANAYLSNNPFNLTPFSTPTLTYIDSDQVIGATDPATGRVHLDPFAATDGGDPDFADHVNIGKDGYGALANAYLAPTDTWPLDDGATDPAATTAGDAATNTPNPVLLPTTAGQNPATLTGGATWTTDATRGETLSLNGTTAGASTTTPVLNTSTSFSVSAWAYLTSTAHTAVIAAQEGTNTPAFTLQYTAGRSWAFTMPDSDSTTPTTIHTAEDADPPTVNTWTHLVATYDDISNTMTLYLNGSPDNGVTDFDATNTTPWNGTGTFDIGHVGNNAHFPGKISNIQTWNYAFAYHQQSALYEQIQ